MFIPGKPFISNLSQFILWDYFFPTEASTILEIAIFRGPPGTGNIEKFLL